MLRFVSMKNTESPTFRAGLTIPGAPYQRKAGPFSRTRSQDFLICGGLAVHFPKKVDDLF